MFRATGDDYVESVPMLLLLLAGAGVAAAWVLLRRSSANVLWAFALVPLVPLVFAEAFSRTRTHARRLRRRRRPGRGALGA